ncbi:MAG TPA: hypothetical protein VJT15_15720 [Pyrinomonadaceae bacterium]|nr:hypothetical protein [Pyrinomonadaceae bacterium]
MKHKTLPLLLAVFLLSGQTSWTIAQQPTQQPTQQIATTNSWTSVQQVGTDERIVVKRKDGKELKGRMIEASETTLTIDRDGKPFAITRDDVRRVHVITGKAEKGKWALIGAAIGGGAGTGIGAIKYSPLVDDSELFIPLGLMVGAGVGAVTGMLIGRGKRKRELVYAVD